MPILAMADTVTQAAATYEPSDTTTKVTTKVTYTFQTAAEAARAARAAHETAVAEAHETAVKAWENCYIGYGIDANAEEYCKNEKLAAFNNNAIQYYTAKVKVICVYNNPIAGSATSTIEKW